MSEKEKLQRLTCRFQQLNNEGKQCVLAISQALLFAQNIMDKASKTGHRHRETIV